MCQKCIISDAKYCTVLFWGFRFRGKNDFKSITTFIKNVSRFSMLGSDLMAHGHRKLVKRGFSKKDRASLSFSLLYVVPVLAAGFPVLAQAAQGASATAQVTPSHAKAAKKTAARTKAVKTSAPVAAPVSAPAATGAAPLSASQTKTARTALAQANTLRRKPVSRKALRFWGHFLKTLTLKACPPLRIFRVRTCSAAALPT